MKPSNWIDGFKPADSAPPQTLWRFVFWNLKGSYPVLILAVFFAVLSGFIEVATALLLGIVTDGAINHGPDFITDKSALLLLIAGFFLILRPAVIGANTGIQALVIGPNVFPLVLSRLHRYMLNHSVQFFDNDFAGRIAQKQMQTARAINEATSALDSEVEAAIQTALSRVMQGKTVLAIAHRLSSIARMDRIIVLDQGQIIEEGTHKELLAQNGKYAGFWERQSGGFIGTEQPL